MLKSLKERWKRFLYATLLPFSVVKIGKNLLTLLLWTCRFEIEGLERFKRIGKNEKCIVMLWHNRVVLAPYIFTKYAPEFLYAGFVSNSRDGELLSALICSYSIGRTIRVPHHSRHQALKALIQCIEEKKQIAIITPDGPRGPVYELKPGVALAAIETQAQVIPFTWTANRYWQLKSWDRLMIPKPFSTITVSFCEPVSFPKESNLKDVQVALQNTLN